MSRTQHYMNQAVQLCGRQVGPASYELMWSQRRIAQQLGISISTLRHHLAAAGATITATNPLRINMAGIMFEAVGMRTAATMANGPWSSSTSAASASENRSGNGSHSSALSGTPHPVGSWCSCGQQANGFGSSVPAPPVAGAPGAAGVPGSANGLAASLLDQAAALQLSAATLLSTAAAVLAGSQMVPARPVVDPCPLPHPSPAEPVSTSREPRDVPRERSPR